ncbi:MAG: radical SAM protein [Candidatus Amulumruptor caecigallinarius]|nr:radical SAM protein [Candidatus Amulumruptor caecigallinarius]MCM1396233.1 radical SAM protein [Candidatus Amulumruptor caecigallinarius]MCM1453767.1 radical SAM protein [bacterium]
MKNFIANTKRIVRRLTGAYRQPLKIEFVVAEHCNLNCKGCTHYSPLAPSDMPSLESVEGDMSRIAKVCGSELAKVGLVGGETLLYPLLPEAMRLLAKYFPDAERVIYTNGLMLPRMDAAFWAAVRESAVVIELTRYPVKFDYDAVIRLCESKGVKVRVYGDRGRHGTFFKFGLDPTGKQDASLSHFRCFNRGCLTVTEGKLFGCATSAFIGRLNAVSQEQFNLTEKDYISLDGLTDVKQVKRFINHAVPFCRYCVTPHKVVPYGPSRRDPSEWIEEASQ